VVVSDTQEILAVVAMAVLEALPLAGQTLELAVTVVTVLKVVLVLGRLLVVVALVDTLVLVVTEHKVVTTVIMLPLVAVAAVAAEAHQHILLTLVAAAVLEFMEKAQLGLAGMVHITKAAKEMQVQVVLAEALHRVAVLMVAEVEEAVVTAVIKGLRARFVSSGPELLANSHQLA